MNQFSTPLRTALIIGLTLAGTTGVCFSQTGKRAELPPERLSPSIFLKHAFVRFEIEIEGDQRRRLDILKREAQDLVRKEFEELGKTPPAKRRQKVAEFAVRRAKRQAVVERRVQAILTKKQHKRLREIAIQLRGPQAFCTKELIDLLKLDEQQQSRMNKIRGDRAVEVRNIVLGRGNGPEATRAMLKKIHQMETRLTKRAEEVLSKKQKATYRSLVGKEFDRSKISGGRF